MSRIENLNIELNDLRTAFIAGRVQWQKHALATMHEREISRSEIRQVVLDEQWIDNTVSELLENIVADARQKHMLVEIASLADTAASHVALAA